MLSWDTPAEVHFLLLYFDLKEIRHFIYAFLLIITILYLSHKFGINFFVIFCNTTFWCRQEHLRPPKRADHRHKANIERRGFIRVRPIILREIVTLIKIVWLQWFLDNAQSALLCPGPECDIFSIAIVDIISRSALVGFSLLCLIYYYNFTELVCYVY